MKLIHITILFLLIASFSLAQKIKLISKNDLKAIENVYIFANNTFVITDSFGEANLEKFSQSDTLFFQHSSFKTYSILFSQLMVQDYIVKLTESIIDIDEIIVSANRWQQNKAEVANRVVKVTSDDIAFNDAQTTADLLGSSEAVFIQKSQMGGGSPMIRGFASNRILIVIDDVRMNNAIFRSGNLQNVISLDANSMESAEIIMGPGSVIYGSDAIGGVMNFQTINPELTKYGSKFFGNTLTRYSSATNEKTGHIDFGFATAKLGFLSSLSYSDFGNLRMGTIENEDYTQKYYVDRINGMDTMLVNSDKNLQMPTSYKQLNLMQKILFKPNDKLDFKYSFYYSQLSDVSRYDRLIEYTIADELKYAEWFYGPQKWMMNSLSGIYAGKNNLFDQAKFKIAYQNYEESRNDRKFMTDRIRKRTEKLGILSLNMDFKKQLNDSDKLFFGLEYVHNQLISTGQEQIILNGLSQTYASRYPDGSSYSSYAAYVSYKHKISKSINLLLAGRYSKIIIMADFDPTFYPFPFSKVRTDNNAISPSIGIVYRPELSWLFKLNGSVGFRAPNIDDIGKTFDSEPGKVIVPNPDLTPEFAFNADFEITKTIGSKVQIEAVAFYTWLQNAIVRRDFLFDIRDSIFYDGEMSKVQALINASNAYVYGFQVALKTELFRNVEFQSHLSYNIGKEYIRETDGYVPLRHAAPLFGSIHLIYKTENFKVDFYTLFNDQVSFKNLAPCEIAKPSIYASDSEGNPYSPAWYTLNFKLSYRLKKHLRFNIGIENIMDVRYRPYSSGIVSAGRNFIFSLRTTI